ncbi:hypothetical protein BB560_000788 [Smittium megazygosporum]|uniref:Major facilitator superfamily (MFS) profile domain-containing protein n=1 Tax=Smittium megazygosporum TaxID=133381 RepID=A0A2T9ZJC9_9FUNG|nr:hypothetical protein BB560_000788 [Smittium megazygosporum]
MGRYAQSYLIAGIASVGGLLFGYDIGIIANILAMSWFRLYFRYPDATQVGVITSFLTLGCFVGALGAGHLCDRISRKRTIIMASLIFVVGSLIQAVATNTGFLIFGRFVNGLAVGFLSQAVPTYQCELAAPEVRGRLISLQQWSITWGIVVAFWICIGTSNIDSNLSWRLPLYLQIIPAAILLVAMPRMPYSPRWLLLKGRDQEALLVLARIRSGGDMSDPAMVQEYKSVREAIEIENRVSLKSYSELLKFPIRRRLVLGILTQMFQQLTGINTIMYYAPSIFRRAGIGGNSGPMIAQGINGIVNVLFTIPAILFVDRWGRRLTLMMGAIGCGLSYLILAISIYLNSGTVTKIETVNNVQLTTVSSKIVIPPWVGITMIYTFVASFASSWGPVAWIYPAEIFPMSMRSKGTSITTATNWFFNFIVGLVSPMLIHSMSWGLYALFFVFMVIAVIVIYLFYPETKGRSLEQMEVIFRGSVWAIRDQSRIAEELNNEKQNKERYQNV